MPDVSERGQAFALAAIVLAATLAYAAAGQLVSTPRVHPDEHIYAGAAASLGEGEGLRLRGEPYAFGPVYPALLGPVLAIAGNREDAYPLYKLLNALLFALAAVPLYFLARRLLPAWWSIGVAALAVLIPSSMYVALVMTESAAYLACSTALLAIVLALERPTSARQIGVLLAIGLAYAVRAQFAALFVAYVVALVLMWALAPHRPRARIALRRAWPTLAALAGGVVLFAVRPLLSGTSPLDTVGAYEVLFRGYDPLDIVAWGAYHVADIAIYLALVPVAVAPIVLTLLWRRGRTGSRASTAFLATFLSVNAAMLFVISAFSSTEFGFDRLHDRNLFYVIPLWIVVLGVWLAENLPRPRVETAVGIGLAFGLILVLPFRYIASDVGVDVVPSALWARLEEFLAGEPITARKLMMLAAIVLLACVAFLPRRLRWSFPAVLLASFAATGVLAWERIANASEDAVYRGAPERRWVDDRLPSDARVLKVYLVTDECPASAVTWHALYLTEFFNRSLERAAYIGDSIPDGLPIRRVEVTTDGTLADENGTALRAEYVVTQPGIELDGEELGRGTAAGLTLWRTTGEVRVLGAATSDDVRTADCA